MSNQIDSITCESCKLTITAKKNADDDKVLHLMERHILEIHLEDNVEIDAVIREVN